MNYNNFQQQQYMQPQVGYKQPAMQQYYNWNGNQQVRPVSSIEEAKASPIDFDGTVFYFPDLANKRIYTKHIGMDGIAVLNMYELKEMPIQQPQKEIDLSHYVTREELEQTILQFKGMLEQTLNNKKEVKEPVVNF